VDGDRDNVIGILLAKDLLRSFSEEDFALRDQLRPAIFIPESKRLNVLLKEFRASRNHIAIVVDEYGGVAGLVTIEDVLEQIVGDIEDEYDYDEAEDNIISEDADDTGERVWRVKAQTEISDLNQALGANFTDDEFDTVGGLVTHAFGRVPKRGESLEIAAYRFHVLRADSRRLHTLRVERLPQTSLQLG
jgi:magnesium and cobalt transporter